MLQAFPKPGQIRQRKPAVKVFPDGREVCQKNAAGKREYARRTAQMWNRQKGICGLRISPGCAIEVPIYLATFEHEAGRGFNGGHRDDRIEIEGKPVNCMACAECNFHKGSRRIDVNTNNNVA